MNNYLKLIARSSVRMAELEELLSVDLLTLDPQIVIERSKLRHAFRLDNPTRSVLVWTFPFDDGSPSSIESARQAVGVVSAKLAEYLTPPVRKRVSVQISAWLPFPTNGLPVVGDTSHLETASKAKGVYL